MSLRSFLYKAARAIGDYNAVKRGGLTGLVKRKIRNKVRSRVLRFLKL